MLQALCALKMVYLHKLTKTIVLNLPFFIAKRIAFNREQSFSRFIIRLSIAATALSVAAMILSLSFINGFQKVVSEKVFSFWGHIRVQHFEPFKVSIAEEFPIQKNDTAEKAIISDGRVKYLQPFATKSAILKSSETIEGILFKGVDRGYHFEEVEQFRMKGKWPSFNSDGYSTDIMISEYHAQQLKLDVGKELLIYFIQPGQEAPRTRKLKVCGIYKTGIEIYDKIYVLGDIGLIRKLNDWHNGLIGGYEVFLKDYSTMAETSESIYTALPIGWDSKTMKEIYPEIFDWLNLQNTNKYILLIVMTIVAVINLITCLIILVLERTRMIGVLKALGNNDWKVQQIFMLQGAYIALTGVIIGLIVGLGLSYLQLKTGFITLNEEAYYMKVAPVYIIWWQVIAVTIGTFLVCFTILLIPSWISRRISPAKAIQFS
ncbi:MAG TPA: FtsX-like permease family protein [Chitinophagaceae bacterium]|nr:FtsX-like permease family protein [Chitinophagaceae bacterium]